MQWHLIFWDCVLTECHNLWKCEPYTCPYPFDRPIRVPPGVCYRWEKNKLTLVKWQVVRGTPTAGVILHWVIISRRWEQNHKHNRKQHINTDSPRKKVLRFSGQTAKFQAPKTLRTDTILPEHLLVHTLIIYIYSWITLLHLVLLSPFSCKTDALITSTRIEFSNPENITVAYSCLHKLYIYC